MSPKLGSVGPGYGSAFLARGVGEKMGLLALNLGYDTDESREGVNALKDRREPEFRKFAK